MSDAQERERSGDRAPVVRYLRRVEREATDRPRALAAGILADTLARWRDAERDSQPRHQGR